MTYQVIIAAQTVASTHPSFAEAVSVAKALVASGALGVSVEAVPQSPLVSPWTVWPL